jgi:4-methyl-5(b-hydroxyethyl)-thiazole monophosphate biosynthesis
MKIYMFLADGFEEVEALAPLDILRRAGLDIKTVGIGGRNIKGAHGITVLADICENELNGVADAVILPGGMPGTLNLDASPTVEREIISTAAAGGYTCAICAAPRVLGRIGLLDGKRFTCYPETEELIPKGIYTADRVTVDGKCVTARGMGCAVDFGLTLVELFCGEELAKKLRVATISD